MSKPGERLAANITIANCCMYCLLRTTIGAEQSNEALHDWLAWMCGGSEPLYAWGNLVVCTCRRSSIDVIVLYVCQYTLGWVYQPNHDLVLPWYRTRDTDHVHPHNDARADEKCVPWQMCAGARIDHATLVGPYPVALLNSSLPRVCSNRCTVHVLSVAGLAAALNLSA
jgi:hypothetical protein